MDICRFCGSRSDLLVSIFYGEGLELGLEAKIRRHLPVNVSVGDSLPKNVCYPCVDFILGWDTFVTFCVDIDKKLRPENEQERIDEQIGNDGVDYVRDSFSESDDDILKNPANTRKSGNKERPTESPIKIDLNDGLTDSFSDSDDEPLMKKIKKEEDANKQKLASNGTSENGVCINVCRLCGKMFKSSKYLSKHMMNCGKEEDLTCKVCNAVYKTRTYLVKHIEREHNVDQTPCPVCSQSVVSKKMGFHLKTVHSLRSPREAKFKCKYCELQFSNKYAKNSHIKEIHHNVPIKCKYCDFKGVHNVLKRHTRTVHSTKQFPCAKCPVVCKTVHLLKAHMTAHSDLRSYICDICGMRFKRLNNVRDHMKCHQQKSNQCQICGNFFARKRYLAIHERTIHNLYPDGAAPEQKGFECGVCGAKLKWKKNLLAHMRIHTGEKPYSCKVCNKDFTCHGTLRTHMSKHSVVTSVNHVDFIAEIKPETSVDVDSHIIKPEPLILILSS